MRLQSCGVTSPWDLCPYLELNSLPSQVAGVGSITRLPRQGSARARVHFWILLTSYLQEVDASSLSGKDGSFVTLSSDQEIPE